MHGSHTYVAVIIRTDGNHASVKWSGVDVNRSSVGWRPLQLNKTVTGYTVNRRLVFITTFRTCFNIITKNAEYDIDSVF